MRSLVTNLARTIHSMLSTWHHPIRVAVQDAIMASVAFIPVQLLSLYIENHEGHSYTVSMSPTDMLVTMAFPAVLAAFFGGLGSQYVRSRIYLVRSVRKALMGTIVALSLPTTLIWVGFGLLGAGFGLASWVSVVSMFGIGVANFGFRAYGFEDPKGVAKMLVEGRTVDAHVATMGLYAEHGIDVIVHSR